VLHPQILKIRLFYYGKGNMSEKDPSYLHFLSSSALQEGGGGRGGGGTPLCHTVLHKHPPLTHLPSLPFTGGSRPLPANSWLRAVLPERPGSYSVLSGAAGRSHKCPKTFRQRWRVRDTIGVIVEASVLQYDLGCGGCTVLRQQ
jgi:hypothetical protein